MGNCCGGERQPQTSQPNQVSKQTENRLRTWRTTGAIGLRGANLKVGAQGSLVLLSRRPGPGSVSMADTVDEVSAIYSEPQLIADIGFSFFYSPSLKVSIAKAPEKGSLFKYTYGTWTPH